jgi:hypothetical protein
MTVDLPAGVPPDMPAEPRGDQSRLNEADRGTPEARRSLTQQRDRQEQEAKGISRVGRFLR